MKAKQFKIGDEFRLSDRLWRCTDVGTRTVVAIRIDAVEVTTMSSTGQRSTTVLTRYKAEEQGWFNGPPYPVAEHVFDEDDLKGIGA